MEKVAKCACGSASLRISGDPVVHSVCHCNNCKKRTGSAFGVAAYFPRKSVIGFDGPTTIYAFHNASRDEDQERHFCSRCGTTLYGYISKLPELLWIASGCFADDPLSDPNSTASLSKKCGWVTVPNDWKVWPE